MERDAGRGKLERSPEASEQRTIGETVHFRIRPFPSKHFYFSALRE